MNYNSVIDITKILNDYSQDIQEGIVEIAENVAQDDVRELKSTSPKNTGKYAKGWQVSKTKGTGYVECIVHNGKRWQLTHLLEKSHLLRNGRKSTPKVHIYPVEQKSNQQFERQVEQLIQNGGK